MLRLSHLLLAIAASCVTACSEQPEGLQDLGRGDVEEERLDVQATKRFEESLMDSASRLSQKSNSAIEVGNVNQLEELSEADRAALRAFAEIELAESAQLKAEEQAKKESDNRVQ